MIGAVASPGAPARRGARRKVAGGADPGQHAGDVPKIDLAEGGLKLVRAHSERPEPDAQLVGQLRELGLIGRQDRRQLGHRQRQRGRQAEDYHDQHDQRDRDR
jgi:hypothetical protein